MDFQAASSSEFIKKLPKDFSDPQKMQAVLKRMELSILTPLLDDKKGEERISRWHALECQLLAVFQNTSSEIADIQVEFLNYFNVPYTAKSQISGGLASNYIHCDIPVADRLDLQVQITREQFETKTSLAHIEIDETGAINVDCSDEGKLLNHTKFSKKTRVPFFQDKISFFSQYGGDIYSRITEQPSNFMNFWKLFCLLQPTAETNISSVIEFNRAVALNAFNQLSGAVDLLFHTGISNSCCQIGFGMQGGSVSFTGYADGQPVSYTHVQYPFELLCSGLKTKFTMMKYRILAFIDDVICINNIIDWIYNCLCQSHINIDQMRSFEPYDDIYEFINLLGKDKAESCTDDAIYKPIRPSMMNE